MESFNQLFTLQVEGDNIGLNSDVLETGLINILILLVILIIAIQDFLGQLLIERKESIIQDIQNAENRLKDAENRLQDAKKQVQQIPVLLQQIRDETVATKKMLLETNIFEIENDLKTQFERTVLAYQTKERKVFLQIKKTIIRLVFHEIVSRVHQMFDPQRQDKLVDEITNKIEGDL